MKDYEFNKPINTVSELRKYIGKPVYLWYPIMGARIGTKEENEPYFAWIKTVEECDDYCNMGSVKHIGISGYNALAVIKDREKVNYFIHKFDHNKPCMSNAQQYIRTLTKEEFDMYRRKTIKRRMLLENDI